MVRRLVLLALLGALGAPVAGCSGGGGDDGGDAEALLRDTFNAQKSVRSGRLDLRMDVDARGIEGLGGPLAIHLTGPFDNGGEGAIPKFDFDLDLRAGRTRLRAGTVSDGRKGYLRLQGRAYTLTDELFKRLAPRRRDGAGGSAGPTLSGLGVDPRRWLRDPHEVGEEQVGGVATIHIAGDIDVSRFLGDLDKLLGRAGGLALPGGAGAAGALTEAQRDLLSKSIESAKADIWTGKQDKAMRRFSVLVRFRPAKEGAEAGRMRFDLTVADLNRRQAIGPPANPRPLSELTTALALLMSGQADDGAAGARAGGSGGADSGASRGGGAGGSPGGAAGASAASGAAAPAPRSSTTASRYDACLADAGTDLAKVQRCAALLGQ